MDQRIEDAVLIKWCRQNRREGYDGLFGKYQRYVYTLCYRYTSSREDALDLTQEIFLKLFGSLGDFDERKPLLPWLKRIAVNTCLNHLRDNKNHLQYNTALPDDENDLQPVDTAAGRDNTEELVVAVDVKRVLEKEIAALPPAEKMALILRHIKGMSYEGIASLMQCPLGTIKTYLYRARKNLKDRLKKQGIWEVE